MLRIFRYLSIREWRFIIAGVLFIIGQVWLDLRLPEYMTEITVLVQTPESDMAEIWAAGGYMLLCALGSFAFAIIVGFFASRVGASFSQRIRSMLFNKVESFSMEEINRFSTSSLITRSTNDVTQIQMFVTIALQVAVKSPILAVSAINKISGVSFEWTFATAMAVLFLSFFVFGIIIFALPKFRQMQALTDNLTRVARENLTGLRVIRAYNAEEYQGNKFEKANMELTGTQLFTSRAMSLMMPVMNVVTGGMSLSIYWIGAYLIEAAQAPMKLELFSNMVVFMAYAMQVIMSFVMLVMIFFFLPRAAVSAKRINEVLDTETAVAEGTVLNGKPECAGEIIFKNVSFKYPGAADYVLKDISFEVKKGETIAFIGSTGSGKSTLINLVPRFFDVTEGEVYIDGINIRDYTFEALYKKIGYVPQTAVIFKGSVSSNVEYGDNPEGEDEVIRAVSIAQGAEFVEKMENTYQASVAQGGSNISGGQKQRLAIARAVARRPEIYIFDDSFSALDYKTDRLLRHTLKNETAGVTTMIVAQRIGTIMDADKIVVLDEGRIAGIGTHRELLKNCGVYREIAESQLSEEELA